MAGSERERLFGYSPFFFSLSKIQIMSAGFSPKSPILILYWLWLENVGSRPTITQVICRKLELEMAISHRSRSGFYPLVDWLNELTFHQYFFPTLYCPN